MKIRPALGAEGILPSNGDALEYIIYSPFGGTLVDVKTGAYENKNKYTGKEKDEDTGWYYYGARYYDAERGVFLSEDPVFLSLGSTKFEKEQKQGIKDPQIINSFNYARSNPITYKDPDGNQAQAIITALPALSSGTQLLIMNLGFVANTILNAAIQVADPGSPVGGARTAVYSAVDDAGKTVYVGITNNLGRRAAEHAATKGISIKALDGLTGLTRQAARGTEQALIESFGLERNGGSLMNKINSIASSNPAYQRLVDQGKTLIENVKK